MKIKFLGLFFLLITTQKGFSQKSEDSTKLNLLKKELTSCSDDTCRLSKLFELHYTQQSILGELNENNVGKFNTSYTKQAIKLAIALQKYDTLKALTVDLGYIFDLNKEYDSSFVYYDNCFNLFDASEKYNLSSSIAQNILYNNSLLQNIIKEKNKKAIEQKNKIDRLNYTAFAILTLFILFLIYFFYKSYKNNNLLKEQKRIIIESNKEIESSIVYAKNIQSAILSDEFKLQEHFSKSFVIFLPRDKVSGDFLWTYKKNNKVYIAVVDCTGHGVSGALLSIVGHFLFDKLISTNNEDSPGMILELLHFSLIRALNQHLEVNSRYGMDIGLIRIDLLANELVYSGANRSLYHIRDKEITELKGTRRPAGGTQITYKNNYQEFKLNLIKGDSIYCFSDGYADQIGGLKNKRLYTAKMLELINENKHKFMNEQKQILLHEFEKHKGVNEQTDDVLVIGINY